MRRTDKEITEREAIDAIIARSLVCRLAMCDGGAPYLVPLCFGYDGTSLYFHGAGEGKKMEILRKNNAVCFEFDTDTEVVKGENPCSFSLRYRSVVGRGRAFFVEDVGGKLKALESIMRQYGDDDGVLEEKDAAHITVIRVDIEEMSGKKSKME
ncbi:MAG TPA: pyridoxamine 5'-phosphate oxidase family protein [Deltaproteobacteria bacterium]|jgi:hypothetical protein|nr:pyridoxamine 5'-phosphate oxidase family protein [Deltaproteobacteria bacterium]HOI08318.1 pyridoxamine 5'-phosphate oxidase family protein [Deltaproteobacteria bacterium]